jgi:hypothetical protein
MPINVTGIPSVNASLALDPSSRGRRTRLRTTTNPLPTASLGYIGRTWRLTSLDRRKFSGTLTIPYRRSELGWVQEDTLRMFRFHGARETWEILTDSSAVSVTQTAVAARVDRPGTYMLIGITAHPLLRPLLCRWVTDSDLLEPLSAADRTLYQQQTIRQFIGNFDVRSLFYDHRALLRAFLSRGEAAPPEAQWLASRPGIPQEADQEIARARALDPLTIPEQQILVPRACAASTVWRSVGPHHISGAMRQVVAHPRRPNYLFAVSASGGVWCLDDITQYPARPWRPLTEDMDSFRFRSLAIGARRSRNPARRLRIYISNVVKLLSPRPAIIRSEIYRSTDGGSSWELIVGRDVMSTMGLVRKLAVDPFNPDVLWAATAGGLWRKGSTNAWFQMDTRDVMDVAIDPANSQLIYMGVRRNGLFKSSNGGQKFTKILSFDSDLAHNRQIIQIALGHRKRNGRQQSTARRTVAVRFGDEVSVHPRGGEDPDPNNTLWRRVTLTPSIVANVDATKLSRALDGGAKTRSDEAEPLVRRGEWHNCFAIDPRDPDHLFIGAVNLLSSTDGGATWKIISPHPHEDFHSIAFDPFVNGTVYLAGDGGVFSSVDGGKTWPSMSLSNTRRKRGAGLNLARGLVTSEIVSARVRHGTCVAAIDHTGIIYSGDFASRWQFAFASADHSALHGLEGSKLFLDPESRYRFFIFRSKDDVADRDDSDADETRRFLHRITFQSDGDTYRAIDEAVDDFGHVTQVSSRILGAQPEYAPEARFFYDWFAGPLAAKKHEGKIEIIYGANDPAAEYGNRFVIRRLTLGGWWPETRIMFRSATCCTAVRYLSGEELTAIALLEDGRVLKSDLTRDILFHETPGAIIVGMDEFEAHLIEAPSRDGFLYAAAQHTISTSDDAGSSWHLRTVWPDPNEPIMSLAGHPRNHETLFVGTRKGVYVSTDRALTFRRFGVLLPKIPVTGLFLDHGYLYAATFGRGLWRAALCD